MTKKIYLSGPMTGIENHNHHTFKREAERLRGYGYEVFSPHEVTIAEPDAKDAWHQYMKKDIAGLAQCDTICMLPGWENSRGATLEFFIATQIGLQIQYL